MKKYIKKQGGRCICTGLHLMCIAQAHSLGSYFILPLAWPSSLSYYIPMLRLQPYATLTTNDPILTPKPEKQSIM